MKSFLVRPLYRLSARIRIVVKSTTQNTAITNTINKRFNATFAICILFLHFDLATKSLLSLT